MTQRILLFSSMFVTVCSSAQEKPNIIYIMTDQQTATAMSCMGNTDINTPNMDRLARSGILFQNAYCSAPLSGPSRASMFTGHTSHEIDMATNGKPMPKELRDKSLGILMKAVGYDCVYGGKWHVHTPSIPDGEFGFRNIHNHNDEGLAEACAAYLDNRPQVPFFMVSSFDNPHNICEYARNQNLPFANIQPIDIANCPGLPLNFEQNPYDADIISHEKKLNFSAYPTVSYTPDDWRAYRNAYFRLVEHVDAEIGKIIDAIDRNQLWENSVIIFTSDHGDGMGAHHWNQKSALYEEVINIPLIVVLPKKKNAGKKLSQLINNGVDFFASVCQWAGIHMPDSLHGVSYARLAETGNDSLQHQEYIVTETLFDKGGNTRGWALRTKRYKYVLYDKGRYREQLFDIENDRSEMRNLAVENKYEEGLKRRRALLHKWMNLHSVKQIRPELHLIPGYKPTSPNK